MSKSLKTCPQTIHNPSSRGFQVHLHQRVTKRVDQDGSTHIDTLENSVVLVRVSKGEGVSKGTAKLFVLVGVSVKGFSSVVRAAVRLKVC